MIDELKIFNEFISIMNLAKSTDEIPSRLLIKIVSLFNTEAGSIFLLDEEKKSIINLCSYGTKSGNLQKIYLKPGFGVCGKVIETGKSIFTNDAYKHPDFNNKIDMMTGFTTKNIICSPIILRWKIIGCIEIINKKDGDYLDSDVQLLELIAKYLSYPLENLILAEKINEEKIRNEALIENMTGGLIVIDTDDNIIGYNRKAAQIFSLAQYSVKGRNYKEAFKNLPDFVVMIENYIKTKQFAFRKEITLLINNEVKKIGYSIFIIRRKDDKILAIGISFQDITNI